MSVNDITSFIRKAIDALFLSNKTRTSLGVLIGAVIYGLIQLFKPSLKQIDAIDIDALKLWICIPVGISLLHFQTIVYYVKNGSPQNEPVEQLLDFVNNSSKHGMSDWQKKQMFIQIFNKFLENVELNQETIEKIRGLEGQ